MLHKADLSLEDIEDIFSHIGSVRVLEQTGCNVDHLDDGSLLQVVQHLQAPHTHHLAQTSLGSAQP